jgi:coenzyme PQQ precursor peptide PqqA
LQGGQFPKPFNDLPCVARRKIVCARSASAVARACVLDYPRTTRWFGAGTKKLEEIMAWTTPTLVEICIGLEINGYLPAEF